MWIKTQGGYLLNMNMVTYVEYYADADMTYAYTGNLNHAIAYGDVTTIIAENIQRGTKYMEVG